MSAQDNVERLFALNATLTSRCDALAVALRMVVDDCDVRGPDGRRLPIMPETEACARAALASLERKEG